ncbi:hypothetical protein TWF225_002643 [Orbilia oligospora]|nr:hypothetical protein TWF225_002643 [Orbilia oligospora]KAF3237025.1 hypothetical protein TWF128_001240 [Orbilia oligospora]KAF3277607.1 hypothetical protein TWF132_001420 [Orbilia oligospora]
MFRSAISIGAADYGVPKLVKKAARILRGYGGLQNTESTFHLLTPAWDGGRERLRYQLRGHNLTPIRIRLDSNIPSGINLKYSQRRNVGKQAIPPSTILVKYQSNQQTF